MLGRTIHHTQLFGLFFVDSSHDAIFDNAGETDNGIQWCA